MSILEDIDKQIKEALKAGEKDRLTTLRGLKSDLKYRQIEQKEPLTDQQAVEVLSSCAKKRRESIEQYEKGGRSDLVQKEHYELDIITSFLPRQLGEDELRQLITAAIVQSGADSPQKMGLVMKILMPQIKGKADGKLVNKIVSELLAK
ncbi:MAG: GatB/YqeY domain-containing protein [candidate division Zixibacteria bacterium]|nr:GatB/YqeY domain-containing protein [candidate division Zixibacteria bacterium]